MSYNLSLHQCHTTYLHQCHTTYLYISVIQSIYISVIQPISTSVSYNLSLHQRIWLSSPCFRGQSWDVLTHGLYWWCAWRVQSIPVTVTVGKIWCYCPWLIPKVMFGRWTLLIKLNLVEDTIMSSCISALIQHSFTPRQDMSGYHHNILNDKIYENKKSLL